MEMSLIRAFAIAAGILVCTSCGHPRPWEYPHSQPKEADLVGTYHVVRFDGNLNSIDGFSTKNPIEIVLRPDHTATVSDLPEFDGFGDFVICKLSGPARWELRSGPLSWDMLLLIDSLPKSTVPAHPLVRQCYANFHIQIIGHSAPYGFYHTIGDPDDDKGIELRRVAH